MQDILTYHGDAIYFMNPGACSFWVEVKNLAYYVARRDDGVYISSCSKSMDLICRPDNFSAFFGDTKGRIIPPCPAQDFLQGPLAYKGMSDFELDPTGHGCIIQIEDLLLTLDHNQVQASLSHLSDSNETLLRTGSEILFNSFDLALYPLL